MEVWSGLIRQTSALPMTFESDYVRLTGNGALNFRLPIVNQPQEKFGEGFADQESRVVCVPFQRSPRDASGR